MKTDPSDSLYYKAPENLRKQLESLSKSSVDEKSSFAWNWFRYAAVTAAIIGALFIGHLSKGPSTDDLLSQEVVSSHVRSLMANHLIDIVSTDRHTVKPWFNGKLDFSPKVVDLSADGFILMVAVWIILAVALSPLWFTNTINTLLIFSLGRRLVPKKRELRKKAVLLSRQGYSLYHWISGGMQYWVISDLNPNDLKTLAS